MAALSGEAISKEIWESNPVSISTDAVSGLDTQRTAFLRSSKRRRCTGTSHNRRGDDEPQPRESHRNTIAAVDAVAWLVDIRH